MNPDPRYPIGKFQALQTYAGADRLGFIDRIAALPGKIELAVQGLSDAQLDTPYREGGWTVRQVIHHLADSHMNAYIRVKWTLTEETPTIKAYDEKGWANTPDVAADPALSIALLKALHARWIILLRGLSASELQRSFVHPATGKSVRIDQLIAMYAWHGDHHLTHITALRQTNNW